MHFGFDQLIWGTYIGRIFNMHETESYTPPIVAIQTHPACFVRARRILKLKYIS